MSKPKIKPNLKIAVIGPPKSGKSSLTQRFVFNLMPQFYEPDIYDTYQKPIFVDGIVKLLKIYDCSGYLDFRARTEAILKKCNAFLLVFDVSNRGSYEQVSTYYDLLVRTKQSQTDLPLLLVGNKTDLARVVSFEEANAFAKTELFCNFVETSAKATEDPKAIFSEIVREWRTMLSPAGDCVCGNLTKQGNMTFDAMKAKRRWFVLRDYQLMYYDKAGEQQAIGMIDLRNAVYVERDEPRTFLLQGGNNKKKQKSYLLTAETDREFLEWKTAIQEMTGWQEALV
eukprot:TRINITY_DN19358_c0_g1_i1.p1 TRINITY_DN19358_c0_g1~~TRINITY_DN19358_c0_g1_i1.p1  ORF type:complete len:284 (+),score=57.67 TRINITY_DN19358_c0_g1_i1:793-1644(+)